MTREKAIEVLKGIYPGGAYSPTEEQRLEAINMAIAALSTTQKEPACIYNRTTEERKVSCRYCSATCKARVEETASEYLEMASEKYAYENFECEDYHDGEYFDPIGFAQQSFIAGADWQKEQMMKDAVDAKCLLLPPPDLFKVLLCPQITKKLAKGDKVKLIIVKDSPSSE